MTYTRKQLELALCEVYPERHLKYPLNVDEMVIYSHRALHWKTAKDETQALLQAALDDIRKHGSVQCSD